MSSPVLEPPWCQSQILYLWDTRLAERQGDGDRRGSAVTGGFVLIAARCLRLGARGALDKASDRLAGFGVHPQKRAELGAGDARVPDQGEQFHLILQQRELFLVVVIEEERRI